MGGAAVRLLLEMVQQAGHRMAPRKIVLEPHLLMRESSGRRQLA